MKEKSQNLVEVEKLTRAKDEMTPDIDVKFVGALGLKHPSEKCHGCGAPIHLIIIVKKSLNHIVAYQEGVMRESIESF